MPGFVLGPEGGAAYGFHGSRVLIKASGEQIGARAEPPPSVE